jgi:chemotaxis-related protein WspD
MAADPAPATLGTRAVLVFRIGEEWLAIDTPVIREVVSQRPGHSLPHHPEPAVEGLVNVRGTLEIAVSLQKLMGLEAAPPAGTAADAAQRAVISRTLVLSRQGETFACPVDEVAGILALAPGDIGAVPVTVARAENRHVEGVIATERGPAGLIDPAKLFSELATRVFR